MVLSDAGEPITDPPRGFAPSGSSACGTGSSGLARTSPTQPCPALPCETQQSGDHSTGFSERQLEQPLDRQAELDRRMGEDWRAPGAALIRRLPGHLLVQPDHLGPALPDRSLLVRPVGGAVAGGLGLVHAAGLTAWIRDVNPSWREFCNNAGRSIDDSTIRLIRSS
jgi:hypothetical protein